MPEGEGEMRSRKQENRVEISDFVPDFNFDWSIFRKENIRLTTTRRECEFVVNSFLLENNSGKRCTEAGAVRAHLPVKSKNSVFEREPQT